MAVNNVNGNFFTPKSIEEHAKEYRNTKTETTSSQPVEMSNVKPTIGDNAISRLKKPEDMSAHEVKARLAASNYQNNQLLGTAGNKFINYKYDNLIPDEYKGIAKEIKKDNPNITKSDLYTQVNAKVQNQVLNDPILGPKIKESLANIDKNLSAALDNIDEGKEYKEAQKSMTDKNRLQSTNALLSESRNSKAQKALKEAYENDIQPLLSEEQKKETNKALNSVQAGEKSTSYAQVISSFIENAIKDFKTPTQAWGYENLRIPLRIGGSNTAGQAGSNSGGGGGGSCGPGGSGNNDNGAG